MPVFFAIVDVGYHIVTGFVLPILMMALTGGASVGIIATFTYLKGNTTLKGCLWKQKIYKKNEKQPERVQRCQK